MRAGDSPTSSVPSSRIDPRRGLRMPAIVIISVVLPAPFGPSRQVIWPLPTCSETPLRASILPEAVTRSATSSIESSRDLGGAEIGFAHERVGLDLGRRAFGDFLAEVEHRDAVGDRHDELHVMLDQEDGEALLAELADALF